VRALGVSTINRWPTAPDIPTLDEAGVPGFDMAGWGMVAVPVGTPKYIVARLHAELKEIIGSSEIRDQILKRGMLPGDNSSREELQPFVTSEMDRWGRIVRKVGLAGTQ
jgi:tripartite-type tricarboxylate transporter receptor subunit TctC